MAKRGRRATGSRVHRQTKPRDYSAERARRNAAARAAGFKGADHFQRLARAKTAQGERIRAALAASKLRRGPHRYRVAGLAAGLSKLEGRQGSKRRAADVAQLVSSMKRKPRRRRREEEEEEEEPDIAAFFEAIGSPKKGKK